jgi:hypothetical protein
MQMASEAVNSGLMSVFIKRQSQLGLAMNAARKWCHEIAKLSEPIECQIANYLNSSCRVIGGNIEALDFIELNKKEFEIIKTVRLPVSGAFHTKLMKPAEKPLAKKLESIEFRNPRIKVLLNYDAKSYSKGPSIKKFLVKQISNPVRWEQILNQFYYDLNLPTIDDEETNQKNKNEIENESHSKRDKNLRQSKDRYYPDIYECGPASHTGPILKHINHKAFQFYKHIGV